MEYLFALFVWILMLAVVFAHCWSLSALFSYRFGLLKGVAWFFPLLLPLLGPMIFLVATRPFRELNRPSRKREFIWFAAFFLLFSTSVGYIAVLQYNHFSRRSADAEATGEMTRARALILAHIEKTGQAPDELTEAGFAATKPEIHIIYKKVGSDGFELKAWHDRGEREMKASDANNDIERTQRDMPR